MHPDDLLLPGLRLGSTVVRWLGCAGFELTHPSGATLLIDPYLTRAGLSRLVGRRRVAPDEARLARELPRADGIVVGHSHFDHVLDVPAIARRTGARVFGSRSTVNLLRAGGVDDGQIVECRGGETFEVGPFTVTLVPSLHSRFLFGRVPYPGDIPCSCELPTRLSAYRCGDVFGVAVEVDGARLYHLGSAELIDGAVPAGLRGADVFLMGISGRQATERYVPRALGAVQPRLVVPMHYDDFFRPVDRPMRLLPLTRFGRYVDECRAFDPQLEVGTLAISTR